MLARIRSVSESALRSGALNPAETERIILPGTTETPPFLVHLLHKHNKPRSSTPSFDKPNDTDKKVCTNPFLPYERALHVEDLPPAHVVLLNKFPVVDDHALLVTAKFEAQSSLLTFADYKAMWKCLAAFRSLAFFNAGPIAGASQPHKHLQIVSTPLCHGVGDGDTPFDDKLRSSKDPGVVYSASGLPFLHAATVMRDAAAAAAANDFDTAATLSMERYIALLSSLQPRVLAAGYSPPNDDAKIIDDVVRPFPYNLVVTRNWMLIVPRRAEFFEDISISSLGFVGCLFVKNLDSLDCVRHAGGLGVLDAVTFKDDQHDQHSNSINFM